MKRQTRDDLAILEKAVWKMALAAQDVGLSPHDLINLLDSGMTVAQVLEYITAKQSGRALEN